MSDRPSNHESDPPASTPESRSQRLPRGLLIGAVVFVVVAVAGYLASFIGSQQNALEPIPWVYQPTPGPLLGPPLTPFAMVDPAIIEVLTLDQRPFDVQPFTVLEGVMPVGAFLPQSGLSPDLVGTFLPPPTVVPLPTSHFFQSSDDEGIIPTDVPPTSPLGGPPPEAYGGDGCAPRGMPTGGILTQRFHAWHSGVDFGIPVGTPVTATHSGTVIFAGWSTVGYGNLVIIQNGAFITYYAHLNDFNVIDGQSVGAGSIIAYSGNTGNSTGPHIHYEVRINDVPVDPLTFESRGYRWC